MGRDVLYGQTDTAGFFIDVSSSQLNYEPSSVQGYPVGIFFVLGLGHGLWLTLASFMVRVS